MKFATVAISLCVVLAGCSDGTSDRPASEEIFSITKLGQQKIENRSEYSYDRSVSFTAEQEYLIENMSNNKKPHILMAERTLWQGETLESETATIFLDIIDGKTEYTCINYVNISQSEESSVGSVRCDIEPIAVFYSDAAAALISEEEGS